MRENDIALAGGTLDLQPGQLLIAEDILRAERTGDVEFTHTCAAVVRQVLIPIFAEVDQRYLLSLGYSIRDILQRNGQAKSLVEIFSVTCGAGYRGGEMLLDAEAKDRAITSSQLAAPAHIMNCAHCASTGEQTVFQPTTIHNLRN